MRIFVVDDDEGFREQACVFFSDRGWNATDFPDGEAVIDFLSKSASKVPDAMLLDRFMRGLNGDEVLERLWGQRKLQDMCVIMATGYAEMYSATNAFRRGIYDYVSKPMDLKEVELRFRSGVATVRTRQFTAELLRAVNREIPSAVLESRFAELFGVKVNQSAGSMSTAPERVGASGDGPKGLPRAIELPASGSTTPKAILPADLTLSLADLAGATLKMAEEHDRQLALLREFRDTLASHISTIGTNARQLRDALSANAPVGDSPAQNAHIIANNAAIIESVLQDVKAAAAEPRNPRTALIDLAALAGERLLEFGPDFEDKQIDRHYQGPDTLSMTGDREWLGYALHCLIRNSIEAILDRRKNALPQAPQLAEGDQVVVTIRVEGPMIKLMVEDTGIGFDEETRRNLFQPLFSTKTRRLPQMKDPTGAEKVQRLLGLMSRRLDPGQDGQLVPDDLGDGFEVLIREHDKTAEMLVRHRDSGGAAARIALDNTHMAEWLGRGEGLHGVWKYMTRMGGTVLASSPGVGKGAAFTIIVPKEPVS